MFRTLTLLTASVVAPLLVAPMWAQDDLPDAPGKAVAVRICTGCHGAEMWSSSHRTGDDWDRTITTMTEKGLTITDADYGTVLEYLTKALGPAPTKVNINKATADSIARILGITPEQAQAVVDYRTKNGDFKDLDGLKKVAGISGAVDAKKDRIVF